MILSEAAPRDWLAGYCQVHGPAMWAEPDPGHEARLLAALIAVEAGHPPRRVRYQTMSWCPHGPFFLVRVDESAPLTPAAIQPCKAR